MEFWGTFGAGVLVMLGLWEVGLNIKAGLIAIADAVRETKR